MGVHGSKCIACLRCNKERSKAKAARAIGNEIKAVIEQILLYFVDRYKVLYIHVLNEIRLY